MAAVLAGGGLGVWAPVAMSQSLAVAPAPASSAEASAAPATPKGWPAAPFAPGVMARYPDPPERYTVPALAPGRAMPTSQAELSAWLADTLPLAEGSTRIQHIKAGSTALGVPIEALRFSRGAGRPMVLLVGQQHGDEPAGAEALLQLSRELASGPLAAVLDRLDVLVVPRLNVDGAVWSSRVSSTGMDINRDHLLLRSPEAQVLASLVREQRPVVVVDSHEFTVGGRYLGKFQAVQRFDLLLQYAMVANLPAELGQASEAWFRQPILAAMQAAGHTVEWYYTNPTPAGNRSLAMGGVQPDTGRNVFGLRHAVSLLLETRGVGLGPWHLPRRMHSHLVALRTVLRQAAERADALVALQARADAAVSAQACRGELVVLANPTRTQREVLMLDPATGADKALTVDWDSSLQLQTQRARSRPCGYWLAADQSAAVATLEALGVRVLRLDQAIALRTEAYTERARTEGARPDTRGQVADGVHRVLRLEVDTRAETLSAPAGSYWVTMAQPLANLVAAALEPDTPNSLVANRVIDALAAVRRVVAPLRATGAAAVDNQRP